MLVTMSDKDLSRYKVINDVCERRLRRADAAEILNLSERQVQRLMNRLRESGAASLVHGARGKPSNNRISGDYRQTILTIVRKHYKGWLDKVCNFSCYYSFANVLEPRFIR